MQLAEKRTTVFGINQDILEVLVGEMFLKPNFDNVVQAGADGVSLDENELASVLKMLSVAEESARERVLDLLKINKAES